MTNNFVNKNNILGRTIIMNKKNIMDHCDNHKSIHQSKNLQKKMRNDKKVGEKIKIIILLLIASSSATKEKSCVKGKIHTFSYDISHHFLLFNL